MNTILRNACLAAALLLIPSLAQAAALTAARATESKNLGPIKRYLMKASTTIYAGGMVMIDSNGEALPAAASASNNGVVGVAVATKTSAATGSTYVQAQEGWFLLAGTTLAQTGVGDPVYAEDDQTVDETAATNEPAAGVMMEYVTATSAWVHVALTFSSRWAASADPLTLTGDLTLSGGASALTFSGSAASVVVDDNDTTALVVGSTGLLNLVTLDTGDATETVIITGTTATDAFHVDIGEALFDEKVDVTGDLTLAGAAGALTFSDTASSVVVPDNDATALDVGSTGTLAGLRYDSTDNGEQLIFNSAGFRAVTLAVTGAVTLDASDCGRTMMVTDGIDTFSITLPATVAGCVYSFMFTGTDGGALLDISPNAADAIHGTCTLAASVVEFNGTDDNDIGFTKATINTGDTITLVGDGTEGWYVTACAGIAANN